MRPIYGLPFVAFLALALCGEGLFPPVCGALDCADYSTHPHWLASRYVGPCYGVAVQGDFAYLASKDAGLKVVDISDLESLEPTGVVSGTPFDGRNIVLYGNLAYVADYNYGVRVVDISNPAAPAQVDSVSLSGNAVGLYVYEEHLYVAARTAGLYALSLADPEHPVEVGHIALSGRARQVIVEDSIAYVADNSEMLKIVDVSDPTDPDSIACVVTGGVYCVAKLGNYVYANSGDYLYAIDVTDPSTPAKVDSVPLGSAYLGVARDATRLYFANEANAVTVYDISSPSAPVKWGSIPLGTTQPRGIAYANGCCFAATKDGISTVYIGSEEILRPSGGYGPIAGGLDTIHPFGAGFAFGTALGGQCYTFDVSDPLAPTLLATVGAHLHACEATAAITNVDGRDIALAGNCSGVTVFDITDPYSPDTLCFVDCLEQTYDPMYGFPIAMDAESNYALHIFYWMNNDLYSYIGLWVIDLSNPDSAFVASVNGWQGSAIDIDGHYAYLAGDGGVVVLDITDPVYPMEVGSLSIPGDGCAIKVDAGYGYVGYQATSNPEGPYCLEIFDASDPESPEAMGYVSLSAKPRDIDIVGGQAYVSDHSGGLVVCDVTDPNNPLLIGALYAQDKVLHASAGEGCILMAADDSGLQVAPLCCSLAGVPTGGDWNPSRSVGDNALIRANPNPFHRSTRLAFSLATECRVRLSVYDVTGARVADVLDDVLPAGPHATLFDGSDLAPGVYFTTLDTGERRTTSKIVRLE
jgi:hypothetical protein